MATTSSGLWYRDRGDGRESAVFVGTVLRRHTKANLTLTDILLVQRLGEM